MFHHGNAQTLPLSPKQLGNVSYTVNGKTWNLDDYLKRENVTGMLVLKEGKIAYKYLGDGNTGTTLWTSRSVGKSIVSTLVGIALKEGKIYSLDDDITLYEPDLKGTAWEGTTRATVDAARLRRRVERRLCQSQIRLLRTDTVRSESGHL